MTAFGVQRSVQLLCVLSTCLGLSRSTFTDLEKKFTRTLATAEKNPNCNDTWCSSGAQSSDGYLVHQVAKGPEDELHHLFCTVGAPTLMISRSKNPVTLKVDYNLLKHGQERAVRYEAQGKKKGIDHSFGMIFSNVYEFNDTHDEANLTKVDQSVIKRHPLDAGFLWTYQLKTGDGYHEVVLNASRASNLQGSELMKNDSYISFAVRYDTKTDRLTTRPHMQFSANSTIVTMELGNLNHQENFTAPRYALEMIMFSTEDDTVEEDDSTQVDTTKSMDDEYSPGVFEMRNWQANSTKNRTEAWGYAQWKPVMYVKSTRKNADLSTAKSYPNLPMNRTTLLATIMPNSSLFNSYFGQDINGTDEVSLNATTISFGQVGDNFFTSTNYAVWTMAMGLGPTPTDDVSIMVILVIAIGLGIPLILMVISAIFVFYKSRKTLQQSGYEAINS